MKAFEVNNQYRRSYTVFSLADRFKSLPVHLFAEVDRVKREALSRGQDVIDLGVGDPDVPTPAPIVEACIRALKSPENHRYPYQVGSIKYRDAIVRFFKRRYGVDLDPLKNVVPLLGSKEGIAHFPIVFVNPGEYVIAPDPGYPAYVTGTALAGGELYPLPLTKENRFRMQLESVPLQVRQKTKLLFFNYPNNPTTAPADIDYFNHVSSFCQAHDIIAAHDAAYQELYFESPPPSYLQAKNALARGIEFQSLSKTFNMTGWRVGFAAGEATLIAGLTRLKSNIDTGLFMALQDAAAFALDHIDEFTPPMISLYKKRRDVVMEGLQKTNLVAENPSGTIYVWVEIPYPISSMDFALQLLNSTGVVITPGAGLGRSSDRYFRIALTTTELRLAEAMRRLAEFCKKF